MSKMTINSFMHNEPVKEILKKEDIICQLYRIQNIADLIYRCPERDADTYILQGAAHVIGCLISNLIDDLDV